MWFLLYNMWVLGLKKRLQTHQTKRVSEAWIILRAPLLTWIIIITYICSCLLSLSYDEQDVQGHRLLPTLTSYQHVPVWMKHSAANPDSNAMPRGRTEKGEMSRIHPCIWNATNINQIQSQNGRNSWVKKKGVLLYESAGSQEKVAPNKVCVHLQEWLNTNDLMLPQDGLLQSSTQWRFKTTRREQNRFNDLHDKEIQRKLESPGIQILKTASRFKKNKKNKHHWSRCRKATKCFYKHTYQFIDLFQWRAKQTTHNKTDCGLQSDARRCWSRREGSVVDVGVWHVAKDVFTLSNTRVAPQDLTFE